MHTIELLSDLSEKVPYNVPGFPAYASHSHISRCQSARVATHWHDDLEFGILLSGHMTYDVNGTELPLSSGDGIFVNARQLHSNYSADGNDCDYMCVLIHPSLLCGTPYIKDEFVSPLMTNEAFPYQVLHQNVEWQTQLMALTEGIKTAFFSGDPSFALDVQSLSCKVVQLLHQHMPRNAPISGRVDRRLVTLRNMVGFVQLHYQEKLLLADIAAAGNVSESSCCVIFQQHLHQTPMGYLTRYRIEKGMVLLEQPDLSITDVALEIGFSGASYFTEMFRKTLGTTPSEYRKTGTLPLS